MLDRHAASVLTLDEIRYLVDDLLTADADLMPRWRNAA